MAFTSYDAALHAIARARGLLAGAQASGPRALANQEGSSRRRLFRRGLLPPDTRSDMRRLSVVMAVAALDTYMHRLVVERVFTHDELPGGLARLDVGFEELLKQADATGAAARAAPSNPRPRVGVKRQLRERLLRETFQSSGSVARALSMAGRPKSWPAIAAEVSPDAEHAELKDRLDGIVRRRNQIVHEGDYERLEKPRGSRRESMTDRQAEADIDFLAQIIDAIHAVVS